MKRIAAFVCLIALASATIVSAAPMPWTLFNEPAMLKANRGAQLGSCPNGEEVFLAVFATATESYVMVFAPSTSNILFLYDPAPADKDSLPTEIGFGHVDRENNNVIPPLYWVAFDPTIHGDACTLLMKSGA